MVNLDLIESGCGSQMTILRMRPGFVHLRTNSGIQDAFRRVFLESKPYESGQYHVLQLRLSLSPSSQDTFRLA